MKKGHLGFFYHSNCKNPGIAGVIEVSHALQHEWSFIRFLSILISNTSRTLLSLCQFHQKLYSGLNVIS